MSQVVLLFVCLGAGVLLGATGRIPPDGPRAFNAFVLYVSLPALVLLHVHELRLDRTLWMSVAMPWLIFGAGVLLFLLLLRAGAISRGTAGCLILTAALGNTSFVGLPMIEAYYGKALLGVGVLADQLGTFPALAIPGMLLAAQLTARGERRTGARRALELLSSIVLFPPFLAFAAALALRPFVYPEGVVTLLHKLGDTLSPLALASVGMQLRLGGARRLAREVVLGVGYKLVLAPLLAFVVFGLLLGARGPVCQVTVFEAAMGPMISGSIVAQEQDLNPELAVLIVGVGVPLSFLSLWMWNHLLAAL